VFLVFSKVFSVVLAGIAISKSYVDFLEKRESAPMFVLWVLTWSGIVIIALFPQIVDLVIAYSGGGRMGLGTFFGMVLVFLFFVVYRIYVKLERMERRLTALVQELALREGWSFKDR
jgi:hypothetical protein